VRSTLAAVGSREYTRIPVIHIDCLLCESQLGAISEYLKYAFGAKRLQMEGESFGELEWRDWAKGRGANICRVQPNAPLPCHWQKDPPKARFYGPIPETCNPLVVGVIALISP
jgi:hypothetical protein